MTPEWPFDPFMTFHTCVTSLISERSHWPSGGPSNGPCAWMTSKPPVPLTSSSLGSPRGGGPGVPSGPLQASPSGQWGVAGRWSSPWCSWPASITPSAPASAPSSHRFWQRESGWGQGIGLRKGLDGPKLRNPFPSLHGQGGKACHGLAKVTCRLKCNSSNKIRVFQSIVLNWNLNEPYHHIKLIFLLASSNESMYRIWSL